MARIASSVTVFLSLLFLFTFSYARDIQHTLAESKSETESESGSAADIHPEPETTRWNSKPQQHDTVSVNLDSLDSVPLTFLSFRPINRHGHPRRPLPLSIRHAFRRCRHGHHRREIPYGNDAIVLSNAANGDHRDGFNPANLNGDVGRITTRWMGFPHAEKRFLKKMDLHNHHHHIHSHHHHRDEEHREGWFTKTIHKFMDLF
ncbi:uncharacterized protein LOC133311300 [Gastrolobium bilobum]|uniref:uncharacterized protein LOC133311300 n=1 Tax=Gastrolobium bilobum TaxID=150636 RepID=UPI002AAFDEBF|nr:uncharacterized protein LOC133311300 [Gastrolobium bilobum]